MSNVPAAQANFMIIGNRQNIMDVLDVLRLRGQLSRPVERYYLNRKDSTFEQHMALPYDPKFNTKQFTLFRKFPNEVRHMIWRCASSDAEIVSVEIYRLMVEEKSTKKKKLVNGRYIKRQFSIKYFTAGFAVDLNGNYLERPDGLDFCRDGPKLACVESNEIYLKQKPNQLRLFKSGRFGIIRFNADRDTISIPRHTRFMLHQINIRRRNKTPWFHGFDKVQRVSYAEEKDEETAITLLREQVGEDFADTIVEMEEALFEGEYARFYKDVAWEDAVDLEEELLEKEYRLARNALSKVATGTALKDEVKTFIFPMTKENLLGLEDDAEAEAAPEGGQSS